MITSIYVTEKYNSDGLCWDTKVTWNFNGIGNEVNMASKNVEPFLLQLLSQQVAKKEIETVIKYKGVRQ